ncbi:hypothetical protein PR202_ga13148 [Eleusine coracana subsp. coracana]|uniref:Uncharacterized protein n=1 Tax=Eleusine coracana subsp. coracana TaxID=191504 RepID=A0AAV5CE60_ELECO|nr:hypothetical protein PR202_ga13148 [Eleusine coracana subsp. coracana]
MDGADSDSSRSSPMHVVIFPWLAFGHLLSGLELARRLASRGHRVSFVSKARVAQRRNRATSPRRRPLPLRYLAARFIGVSAFDGNAT